MESLFKNIFDNDSITIVNFLICIGVSFLLGIIYCLVYSIKERSSKSFKISIILLPVIICVVIMMVNGNLGIGVAIAGAFSLVRFRSTQCTAKELSVVFMTMCTGLIIGVGYIGYGVLFTLSICLFLVLLTLVFSIIDKKDVNRTLKITIPEDLDYEEVFVNTLNEYTSFYELTNIKTTNMGSLFKLTYDIKLKKDINEKELIDKLRIENGNLEINLNKKMENTSL